jgi:hypothetical protein
MVLCQDGNSSLACGRIRNFRCVPVYFSLPASAPGTGIGWLKGRWKQPIIIIAMITGATEGAVVQLTKSMAIELAPHNIQVNAIAPGWIETDMTAPVRNSPMNDEILLRTPAGRFGQPDELAGTAIFLASHAADFITGVTLPVDGGYSIR